MHSSGRPVATAVQVSVQSAHLIDSHHLSSPAHVAAVAVNTSPIERQRSRALSDAVLNTALMQDARKANFKELKESRHASPPLNKSPRPEWRQKFRLASDTMQLSPHTQQYFDPNVPLSSPPRAASSHSPASASAVDQAARVALVKGHALKSHLHACKGSADAISIVVPSPPQAGQG